jgi:hypothetical protein
MSNYCKYNANGTRCIKTKIASEDDPARCIYNASTKFCKKIAKVTKPKITKPLVKVPTPPPAKVPTPPAKVPTPPATVPTPPAKVTTPPARVPTPPATVPTPPKKYTKIKEGEISFHTNPPIIFYQNNCKKHRLKKPLHQIMDFMGIAYTKSMPIRDLCAKIEEVITPVSRNGRELASDQDVLKNFGIASFDELSKTDRHKLRMKIDQDIFTPIYLLDKFALFNTPTKKILLNVESPYLTPKDSLTVIEFLENLGLIDERQNNKYNALNVIINFIKTKENFPKLFLPSTSLDKIPDTPQNTPIKTLQLPITRIAFSHLKKIKSKTAPKMMKNKSLIDLIPPENILKNGKDVRMYHGTNLTNWNNIKKNKIKPIGGGMLGKGFYFSPSVTTASNYFKDYYSSKEKAVLVELTIKNAGELKVGEYKYSIHQQNTPLITGGYSGSGLGTLGMYNSGYEGIWQFIVRDQKIIDEHFKIHRVFILDPIKNTF